MMNMNMYNLNQQRVPPPQQPKVSGLLMDVEMDDILHDIDEMLLSSKVTHTPNTAASSSTDSFSDHCHSHHSSHSAHSHGSNSPLNSSSNTDLTTNIAYSVCSSPFTSTAPSVHSHHSHSSYHQPQPQQPMNMNINNMTMTRSYVHPQQPQYVMPAHHVQRVHHNQHHHHFQQQQAVQRAQQRAAMAMTYNNQSTDYKRGKVIEFKANSDIKIQLKDYVFISKDCTQKLGQYIVREQWGKTYALLYKYLDYIFRCQSFGKEVIEIRHNQINKKFLCFNTGLQRRSDNEIMYGLFIPNNMDTQPWRVPFGPIANSFLSKTELLRKLQRCNMSIDCEALPQRTKFTSCLADLLFDASYEIIANWEERLTLNKDRIHKVMGQVAFFDDNRKYMKTGELVEAFKDALYKTRRIADLNPRLAVAQGFVDTTNCKYRMELLLPIIVQFPAYNGKSYKFALAIGKSKEKQGTYVVKSILTMDMAYANARLVGYVDSLWLTYPANHKQMSPSSNINDLCVNR